MIDTLIIHQPSDPYSDCDFRNTEEPERFENPCPVCGLSLDYEGKIIDMCHCVEQVELAREMAEQAMSRLKPVSMKIIEITK